MPELLHPLVRTAHILFGMGGFLLGAFALFLPKFGPHSRWHRWIGRGYGLSMLGMSVLSIPLSIRQGDWLLLVIGVLTLFWVVGGWWALRRWLQARATGQLEVARLWLGRHITLMGSSYIAAWTAFLVNVQPLGGSALLFTLYIAVPSIVGSVAIARAMIRQGRVSGQPFTRLQKGG
ncbi:DUF2306 domain-containing protein [Deinococcus sp. QL22]|uniref:DUF2306 domain-containing protein n=1 Tax=Deinococcus sp. QL22 TaxID=2939437 RepID=UPI00201785D5|nr:DUF2306 domain-containing protein [Deinococcus sp. QL22]UQN09316.1 DUF2306 domain-containing protein [Deinococcus sp. QL22]